MTKMVTNNETSESRSNRRRSLVVDIPDMNLELFDYMFTQIIKGRRVHVPKEPSYVLLERNQIGKFSCKYTFIRTLGPDEDGGDEDGRDEDGRDEDGRVLDSIMVAAMHFKLTTLWVLLEESYGVMQLWIEETFGVQMQPIPNSQTINRRVQAAKEGMNRPGHPGVKAHATAVDRLNNGEPEHSVRAAWRTDYEQETGTAPADMGSGEGELWRKGVKGKRQRPIEK